MFPSNLSNLLLLLLIIAHKCRRTWMGDAEGVLSKDVVH